MMFESEGITEDLPPEEWRVDIINELNKKYGFDSFMFEASDPPVFKWYYDATIIKHGKQEFQLSALTGQLGQPLHSDGGIAIFPYTFQQRGGYIVNCAAFHTWLTLQSWSVITSGYNRK